MGEGVTVELPGRDPVILRHLVLDFSGTLSREGVLLDGVAGRIRRIAERLRVVVLTADTFGRAREALAGLPVEMHMIRTGRDKLAFVEKTGADHVAAIGNGHNDAAMAKRARVGIAVIGPEGAAGDLIASADVVVREINDALDLLLSPLRLTATLRD
jgi:P-type E1-E2 ATPase